MSKIAVEDIPDVLRTYLVGDHVVKPTIPIIVGELIPEPPDQIAVFLNGESNVVTFFGDSGSVGSPLIAFLVRSATYNVGKRNTSIIREMLGKKLSIDNVDIVPASGTMYLGRDNTHLHVFRINFRTIIKE